MIGFQCIEVGRCEERRERLPMREAKEGLVPEAEGRMVVSYVCG